jgi:Putative phage serine protease XkdF
MKKVLPVYELMIDEEEGSVVNAISLVKQPAFESNFLAFNQDDKIEKFVTNDEKKELLGIAIIPEQRIYRRNSANEEYEVFFTAKTIRQIAQQYFKFGFQHSMNMHHSTVPASSFIFQSFIVDESKGVKSPSGLNAPDGSWIIGVKVEDDKIWNDIKSGVVKGFSIEGLFQYSQIENEDKDDKEIMDLIRTINNLIKQNKKK